MDSTPPTTGPAGLYDLHEWGVVAVREGSFEVATGPGLRAIALPMAVDKPVLYVHPVSERPFDLDVRVTSALPVAEHYPPTGLTPLAWHARVEGTCRGAYPTDTDARCPGGYCEIEELGTYETDDAACLSVNGVRAPLLFYRLWAPTSAPALPVVVSRQGDTVVVRNEGIGEAVGGLVRVTHDGATAFASSAAMPPRGGEVSMPRPTGDAASAHADMVRMLESQGLTRSEAQAFDRGWGQALFGAAASETADVLPADHPVAVDRVSNDEWMPNDDLPQQGAPRDRDVLLYWLPAANIDDYARIEATPAPRALHRVFLVRHVLQ